MSFVVDERAKRLVYVRGNLDRGFVPRIDDGAHARHCQMTKCKDDALARSFKSITSTSITFLDVITDLEQSVAFDGLKGKAAVTYEQTG